jgi:hypothetical protein
MKNNGISGEAAQYCDSLVYGGFDDWFLPSLDELNLMYLNLRQPALDCFGNEYWSSSERNLYYTYYQNFGNGSQSNTSKIDALFVRAVRQF